MVENARILRVVARCRLRGYISSINVKPAQSSDFAAYLKIFQEMFLATNIVISVFQKGTDAPWASRSTYITPKPNVELYTLSSVQ